MQKINETKSWLFKKINKIDKPLTRLGRWGRREERGEKGGGGVRQRERERENQNERGNVTTNPKEIQRFVKIYYEQLYVNKLDNLEEINKFLEIYNLPKLNQKESENLNKWITTSGIESIIKSKKPNK